MVSPPKRDALPIASREKEKERKREREREREREKFIINHQVDDMNHSEPSLIDSDDGDDNIISQPVNEDEQNYPGFTRLRNRRRFLLILFRRITYFKKSSLVKSD